MHLTGTFNKSAIVADQRTLNEYEYLRENQLLQINTEEKSKNTLVSFALCNVRSLWKHKLDIISDIRFTNNDLILCTETQLTTTQLCDININEFSVICNNSAHRFSGIAVYYNN